MRTTPMARIGCLIVLFLAACSTATTTPGGGDCDGAPCDAGTADAKKHDAGDGGCVLDIIVMNNPGCTSCLQMNCCPLVNACFGMARDAGPSDCNMLNACQLSCAPMDAGAQQQACFDACKAAHPSSVAPQTAWTDCATASCPMLCN